MNDGAGGAAVATPVAPAQGNQNGQQGYAPAQQRARVGEFGNFSAGVQPAPSGVPVFGADGVQGQSLGLQTLQNAELAEQQGDQRDFSFGPDGQVQTFDPLATSDDPLAPVESEFVQDEQAAANVITAQQLRAELDERRAWLEQDDLAEPFMGKFVTATVDGQRYRIPVSEAVKGYQLHSNYSRQMRELYAFKAQLEQREAGLQKLLMDMDDGQKFLDAMVFLGKFPGFSKAAIIYGTQLDAERRMTPEQRQVHQALRAHRAEMQRLQLENQTLRGALQPQPQQMQQQGPTNEQIQQIYMQQLVHLAPAVAQRIGFVNTKLSQQLFEHHFNSMLPSIQGQDLTSEFVETVMRAAMEDADAELRRSGYAPPPAATQQAQLPPGQPRIPAGNPNGGQWTRAQQQAAQQAARRAQLPPVSQLPGPGGGQTSKPPQRMRISEFAPGKVAARPQ